MHAHPRIHTPPADTYPLDFAAFFGLSEGRSTRLSVTICSSPVPSPEWLAFSVFFMDVICNTSYLMITWYFVRMPQNTTLVFTEYKVCNVVKTDHVCRSCCLRQTVDKRIKEWMKMGRAAQWEQDSSSKICFSSLSNVRGMFNVLILFLPVFWRGGGLWGFEAVISYFG